MRRQRGVALVTAVLVVALAALLVAALLDTGEDARARTRNALRAEQAHAYALGLEAWVTEILHRDADEGPGFDSHASIWAQDPPPLPVPGGRIVGRLVDQNGCLDLNRLVTGEQRAEVAFARFERLLDVLGIDRSVAMQAVDWIDADSVPGPGGAEDLQYQMARPPYRTANRPFAHVSELRLLRGVDEDIYRRLRPHVCALPPPGGPINVNTATLEVLMSLDPAIDETAARRLHQDGRARFANIEAVVAALGAVGVPLLAGSPALANVDVKSTHFLARADILIDDIPFVRHSLIWRDRSGIAVLWRTQDHD